MDLYVGTLANILLERYFLESRCLFIFSDENHFDYTGTMQTVNVLVSNGTFDSRVVFNQHGCQGFVINVETPLTTIINLEYYIRRSCERFNYRRYLILPVENSHENPIDIFRDSLMEYIIDIIIIIPIMVLNHAQDIWSENKFIDFQFYTHKFSGKDSSNQIILIDEWRSNTSSFVHENNLYPDKVKNGDGRIFTVSSLQYVPYTVPEAYDGVEIKLLVEYCVKYNLTPFVIAQDELGNMGTIYENWTGEGLLGLVATDDADIGCEIYRITTKKVKEHHQMSPCQMSDVVIQLLLGSIIAIEHTFGVICMDYIPCDHFQQSHKTQEVFNYATKLITTENQITHSNVAEKYIQEEFSIWIYILFVFKQISIIRNLHILAAIFRWGFMFTYLDISATVLRSGVSCVAPAPVLEQGWLGPLFPFSYPMWALVGASLVVSSIALMIIDLMARKMLMYERSNAEIIQGSIFYTATIIVAQGVDDSLGMQNIAKKCMFGCMFLFTVMISNSYSGGLASSMTVPRYMGAIKTVQDLADSGIAWGAVGTLLWISPILETPEEKYVTIRNRFVVINNETVIPEGKFAYIIEHLPQGYFSFGATITEKQIQSLRRMLEDIYWEHCIYVTRKSSVWIPTLNNFILLIAQSGMPQLWEYQVAMKYANPRIQTFVKYSGYSGDGNVRVRLSWGHVQGAFGIWAIGLLAALLRFSIEIYKSRRTILSPTIIT